MPIKHAFTSAKEDWPDPTIVRPSDWNADHTGGPQDRLWVPGSDPYGLDDEFDNASIDASWILVNPSPVRATWTEGADVLSCYVTNGNGGGQHNAIVKPLGALTPPVTIETAYRYFTPYAYNYFMQGVVFSNSATWGSGQCVNSQGYTNNGIAVSSQLRIHAQNPAFNADSASSAVGNWQWTGSVLYTKLVWTSATSFSAYFSPDGVSWYAVASAWNPGFSLTPTHAGIYTSTWTGGSPSIGSFEYFRVY